MENNTNKKLQSSVHRSFDLLIWAKLIGADNLCLTEILRVAKLLVVCRSL